MRFLYYDLNNKLVATVEYKDGKLTGLDEGGKNTVEFLLDYTPEELHEKVIANYVKNAQVIRPSYETIFTEYDEDEK